MLDEAPTALYRDLPEIDIQEAMNRGRDDVEWFSWYFLRRKPHKGQVEWLTSANATINVLATANRYGKSASIYIRHFHSCFYKLGAEPRYTSPTTGTMDGEKFLSLRYETIHTAGLWDTCSIVWDDALKCIGDSPRLRAFIKDTPRTLPPNIKFQNGSKWKFRTLGDNGEGIDGNSFYLISIDEAGWIGNLRRIMEGVARVRVADVRGRVDIYGTFKPGIARDFYYYANRASVYTGRSISFEHRDGVDYFKEFQVARPR